MKHITFQASSADLRFKVRGFSFGMTQSGLNPRAHIAVVARTCYSRSAVFWALNKRMHIEGKWDAIDPQSAPPLLFLPIDPGVLRHARPLPVKPQTLECGSALRFLHESPAYRA